MIGLFTLENTLGASYENFKIPISGEKLRIFVDAPNNYTHVLKINSPNGTEIPLQSGMVIKTKFESIFFTGSLRGKIRFFYFDRDEDVAYWQQAYGAQDGYLLSAETSYYLDTRCIGIKTLGTGTLEFVLGGDTIAVPCFSGEWFPLSPEQITDNTDVDILILGDN